MRAPAYTRALDYELELGFVLRTGRAVALPRDDPLSGEAFLVVAGWAALRHYQNLHNQNLQDGALDDLPV